MQFSFMGKRGSPNLGQDGAIDAGETFSTISSRTPHVAANVTNGGKTLQLFTESAQTTQ
ncbi:MAG: hypothetical protein KDA42_11115 [Planctomycetales bacterium]|nr:hypothetical protein [Planctomycetales bacterium]